MAKRELFDDLDDDDDDLFGVRTPPTSVRIPQLIPKLSRSVSSTPCGYEAKFVSPLSEDQTCPICQMAICEPRLTVCGHHYCKDCLRPLFGPRQVTCPVCRTQLSESETFPNNALKRQILDLKIRCDQSENGCEWIGNLRDKEMHSTSCAYVHVPCPQDCGETILLIHFMKHKESCVRRIANCCFCGLKLEYRELDDHLTISEKYVVACPHNCGAEMMREQLEHHLSEQGLCPKVPVECEFSDAGCQFKGEKMAVEEHVLTGVVFHLGLVMKQLREVNVQLTREVKQRMLLMPLGQFIYMWRIENWKQKIADAKIGRCSQIEGDKFYDAHPGHCLYLKAYPNGMNLKTAGCVSLFLAPTPGKYDGQVTWPFSHSYSLCIIDQQPQSEDLCVNYSPPTDTFDSPTGKGLGHSRFISHHELSTRCYLKNNSVIFKLIVSV